jgi:hypothetical protein
MTYIAPALEIRIDGSPINQLKLMYHLDDDGALITPSVIVKDEAGEVSSLTALHKIELSTGGQPFQVVSNTFLVTMLQMYGSVVS